MRRGRPLKFESEEEILKLSDEYFNNTPKDEWTITGLALALGTNRQTLVNYESKGDFVDAIKKIKAKVENSYELSLRKHGRSGDIFALKNFGWKDKSEQDITSAGEKIDPVVIYRPEKLIDE